MSDKNNTASQNEKIKEIDEIIHEAMEIVSQDLDQFSKMINIIYEKSLKSNYQNGLTTTSILKGILKFFHADYDQALKNFQDALSLANVNHNPKLQIEGYKWLGNTYGQKGDYQNALEMYSQSLALAQQSGDISTEAEIIQNRAHIYFWLNDYDRALANYHKVLEINEYLGDADPSPSILNAIGVLYGDLGNFEKYIHYCSQALKIVKKTGDKTGQLNCAFNVGKGYFNLGETEKAIQIFQEILPLCRELGNRSTESVILTKLGQIFRDNENWEKALTYHQKSLVIAEDTNSKNIISNALLNLGLTYLTKNKAEANNPQDLNHAFEYLQKSLHIAIEINSKYTIFCAHKYLSDAYEIYGDLGKVVDHYRKYHEIEKEVFNEKSDQRIRQLQIQFEVEQKEKENEMYRLKIKQQQEELTQFVKNLAEKNELIQQLQQDISKLKEESDVPAEDIVNLVLSHLKNNDTSRNNWHLFQEEFDALYPDFISTLVQRYPTLTRQELKVCALIKTGLSTKEIAHVLYINAKSVEKYRNRIRKKLNILPEINLPQFISSI